MAVTNKWGIREVAEASFFDVVTGKLRVKLDTLKVSNLLNTAETVYNNGGSGNPKLIGWSGNRAARFELQDALFTNEMIGMLLGNEVESKQGIATVNNTLVVENDTAELKYTPASSGALVSVNKLHSDGTLSTSFEYTSATPTLDTYSISGKTITFPTGAISDGEKVLVYYETETSEDTKHILASTDKFAGSFKIILDVLVRDYYTKKDYAAQITIFNAKIEDNWNLNMQPDGDASVLDIPMEALKSPDSTDLYIMKIYDDEDLA